MLSMLAGSEADVAATLGIDRAAGFDGKLLCGVSGIDRVGLVIDGCEAEAS